MPGRAQKGLIVGLATGAMVVGLLPVFSLGVLTPFIAADIGLTPAQGGLLSTALFGAATLGSGPAGRLVDRSGSRIGMTVLLVAAISGWSLASVAVAVPSAVLAVGLAGAAMGLATPATTHLLFSVLRGRTLGLSLGVAHSGTQLGAVLAGGILPVIAVALGWRAAVRAATVVPLLVLLLLLLVHVAVPRGRVPPSMAMSRTSFLGALRVVPGLLRLVAFAMLFNAVVNAGVVTLPTYAATVFDLDLVTAGRTTLVMGLSSMVGKVLWGASALGRSGRRGLLVLAGGSSVSLLLLFAAPVLGSWALWVAASLFGFTATTWAVPTTQVAGLFSGPQLSGSASAAVMMAGFAGGALGPPVFGWAVTASGFGPAWTGAAVMLGCSALVVRNLAQPVDRGVDARGGHGGAGD